MTLPFLRIDYPTAIGDLITRPAQRYQADRDRRSSCDSVRHTDIHPAKAWICRGIAKKQDLCQRRRVLLPKPVKRRPPALDEGKLQTLFERARNTRFYPFMVLAAAKLGVPIGLSKY
jgi:hypothetical protein